MKYFTSIICLFVLFCSVSSGQQNQISTELPIENGMVIYKYSGSIPVTREELCNYFFTQSFFDEWFDKLDLESSKMTKESLWKGTDSYSYRLELNSENELGKRVIKQCDPEVNDTIYGKVEFNLNWKSRAITNGHHATKNTQVEFLITMIFMNTQDLYVSLQGLSYKKQEYYPGSNKTNNYNATLIHHYNNFVKSENKVDDDKKLFSDINDLAGLFYNVLFNSLQEHVKSEEK